ncbi:MAG TPA: DMT family transporter [Anaerovoracaceae bacterium]|nr:DMT family transporter [Anaerovoracaceae bacterium]
MLSIKNAKYYIALISAVFIWSSAFIVTKFALTDLGPITLSAIRILIAFLVLLPISLKRGFHFKNLFTKNAFLYGIFGYGGNLVLLSVGLLTCTANISAIIHGLFPVFMIILGHSMLNEGFTRNKVLGIIFSVAGVVIASIGDLSQNSSTTLLGILLVAVSVLTWAFYSVYSKKTAGGMDTFVLSELCFGTGFLCVLPFVILEQLYTDFSMPSGGAIFSLFYLGIMSGTVGILLWNFALKKIDSSVAGIYFNLMPVIGLFLAIFAHERIAFLQISGCILILAGVFICTKPGK